jgi:hypothetical protein
MEKAHCATCDGSHGGMQICPEKPGYTELWRAWVNWERSGLARVAVLGAWLLVFLLVLALRSPCGVGARRPGTSAPSALRRDRLFLLPTNEIA